MSSKNPPGNAHQLGQLAGLFFSKSVALVKGFAHWKLQHWQAKNPIPLHSSHFWFLLSLPPQRGCPCQDFFVARVSAVELPVNLNRHPQHAPFAESFPVPGPGVAQRLRFASFILLLTLPNVNTSQFTLARYKAPNAECQFCLRKNGPADAAPCTFARVQWAECAIGSTINIFCPKVEIRKVLVVNLLLPALQKLSGNSLCFNNTIVIQCCGNGIL